MMVATKKQTRTQAADAMPAEDRREDIPQVADTTTTPKVDGGNPQHPVHDEDQEDRMPSDYEREIDRIDAATRSDR